MLKPLPERRRVSIGYLLWALSIFGVCGIQRFYARKPFSGTLWLLTLGLCGIGQLIDLFLIPHLVEHANQPLLLQQALAEAGRHAPPSIERQLLLLARQAGRAGFTINDAMLAVELPSGSSTEQMRTEIERLMLDDLLDVGNDEHGRVVYREP
ncbi:NINE protein [Synechococcus sp. CS-1325]|uniref:NINE protein n=1 Tax=unclassified Synechococcus TaxID=2626047 RepID=UPI000DB701A8|nr:MULTISPECIES: NINE protein [unclassified Synechococcus]MCT0199465.1 NINE protein [Synechococcus sp. CS-1325]MCT0212959.1 NINE protein [Synechococcus sp. CS-1326]MCT0232203.1 NINE protein [Synechococcus sp. CS-1327]PZV02595.1 MAG: hypothetical protein DCF24_01885 [Cyanobium sp.]